MEAVVKEQSDRVKLQNWLGSNLWGKGERGQTSGHSCVHSTSYPWSAEARRACLIAALSAVMPAMWYLEGGA